MIYETSNSLSAQYQGAAIALVGAAVGFAGNALLQLMSYRHQNKQWIREQKLAEYRELQNAISKGVQLMERCSPYFGYANSAKAESDPHLRETYSMAAGEVRTIIENRVLIADQVRNENILDLWKLLAAEKGYSQFQDYWRRIRAALEKAVRADLDLVP